MLLLFHNCSPKCTTYCKITSNCDIKAKNKCYILEKEFHYFLKTKYVNKKKHHKYCALLVAPIVALSVCRLYMWFFRVFPWRLFFMQVKLVSALENKEQLICFGIYGKSALSAQTDGGGQGCTDRPLYTGHFNYCIAYGEIPDELKHIDVIPIYKKNEKCTKRNYRPVSILTNISKTSEKLMYNQLSNYFDSLLATSQCEFRKGFSSQYCLLVMLEKFKESIDRENQFGTLLTDLSKAFDYIDRKLLIEKLYEYGVLSSALNLIYLLPETQNTENQT